MAPVRGVVLAVLALLAFASRADERILDFHSDIAIAADGSMEVEETIRVRAEGAAIRHGIYRDFPTTYRDGLGNRFRVGFKVLSARRDGMPETFALHALGNGVRIYLGRADRMVTPGMHEYELRYRTTRQLGFFADHDELYWNVTGNGWLFAIDSASARVTLPARAGFSVGAVEGYVGVQGSREQAYRARIEGPDTASIRTTRPLRPHEGITVVVSWKKGWIAAPSTARRMGWLLADNAGLEAALAGFAAVLLYLTYAWSKAGRDPSRGVIFPHYTPPEHFSPAAVRFVGRMSYDTKALSAAVIDLAVKGHLTIEEAGRKYTLRRQRSGGAELAAPERALFEALFAEGDEVRLENANYRLLRKAMQAHRRALGRQYARVYFLTNSTLLIPAAVLLAVTLAAVLFIGQMAPAVIATLALTVLLLPIFAYLLKAPTRLGRRRLDEIEGFKLYLDVAEKDELNLRNPPEKTPALFETFLPFALALGVEQRWAEKFARVFAGLEAQTGIAYRPAWYSGRWSSAMIAGDLGRFTADMTKSLGDAIASASRPPGSSAGAGGGGFSGGGGGGGGGGGW